MFLIVLVITLLAARLKRRVSGYIWIYSFGLLCFSLAIDGNWFGVWNYMYEYEKVETTPLVLYYYLVYLLSFILFFCMLSNSEIRIDISEGEGLNRDVDDKYWNDSRIRSVATILALTSLIAGVYNFINAGPISILFLNARAWELSFGRNFLTNYIYFLHLPALVLYGYLIGRRSGRTKDYLIVSLLLFETTWHGIKFTLLHGFIFYLAGFYLASREIVSSKIVNAVLMLLGILIAFFVFVRGGGVEGFFSYIASPAINSMHYINNNSQVDLGSLSNFNPFGIIPVDKIKEKILGGEIIVDDEYNRGFVLNDKYNLQSAITSTNLLYGFGFIFYSFLFAILLNYLRSRTEFTPVLLYVYAMLLDVMLLLFTAFELFKTKLWTSLVILVMVVFMLRWLNAIKIKFIVFERKK